MKRLLLISCLILACACAVSAQRPKLTLRVFGGAHTHTFVYKEDPKTSDTFGGWQGSFGFRVTWRKLMGEVDFSFVRNRLTLTLPDSISTEDELVVFKLNAFEIPLKAGVNIVHTPLFKWYGYTGVGLRFPTKVRVDLDGEEYEFKPKEVELSNPNVDWIVGTQFDVAWFTFEVMYSLGINNALRESIRTNSHEVHFSVGLWF